MNLIINLLIIRKKWYFVFLGIFMTGIAVSLLSLLLKISLLISEENEARDKFLSNGNSIEKTEADLEDKDTIWQREETLDSLILKWNYTNEYLLMMALSQTNNCIAIGFNSSSKIEVDFVIGCVKNGSVHLKDYHTNENQQLILDEVQDYDPIIGKQNETHTLFLFKRKLNTCDKFNIEFTVDTIKLIWHFLDEGFDQINETKILPMTYHNTITTFLLNMEFTKPKAETLQTYDVLTGNINIASPRTIIHYCKLIKVKDFGKQHHIIGYETIIDPRSKGIIHHLLLSHCIFDTPVKEGGELCEGLASTYLFNKCDAWIGGTASSTKGTFYPPHIGSLFGSTVEKHMYFFLQIHFNTPRKHFVLRDNSGFRLYHTEELRQFTSGSLKVGIEGFQLIPPNRTEVSNVGICTADCIQEYLPSNGVFIVGYFFHAHQRARKMRLHQIRNGREVARFADENYDFNFQKMRFLSKEIQILPNDTLIMECIYDSRNETVLITHGLTTVDEKCEVYLQIYPPIDIFKCISSLFMRNLTELIEDIPEFENTSIVSPRAMQLFRWHSLNSYFWANRERAVDSQLLRNIYFDGYHDTLCRHNNGEIIGVEKLEDFIPLSEDKTCSYAKLTEVKER